MRRILITGSRDWTDVGTITAALLTHGPGIVVHGACPTGADQLADEIARGWGWAVERHPADWDRHGKAAGPLRNAQMVDLGADVCLAFPLAASRGTRNCMRLAREAGIPVHDYEESAR